MKPTMYFKLAGLGYGEGLEGSIQKKARFCGGLNICGAKVISYEVNDGYP